MRFEVKTNGLEPACATADLLTFDRYPILLEDLLLEVRVRAGEIGVAESAGVLKKKPKQYLTSFSMG